MIRLLSGDCRDVLPTLPAESVQCVVTSPPYFGLRDYGTALWDGGDADCQHTFARNDARLMVGSNGTLGKNCTSWTHRDATPPRQCACGAVRVDRQIGLEATPDEYLSTMVGVFREIRRVMRNDAVAFINMGDSYADKQLQMIPARLAIALQADGWVLRSDIIWHKPNPMPESVTDRPTRSHEYVFLLTKSARYYYNQQGIAEVLDRPEEADRQTPARFGGALKHVDAFKQSRLHSGNEYRGTPSGTRNARSVWTIATHAYPNAHFATYPPELAERCIRAGTSERGCCAACGKPWVRVTERDGYTPSTSHNHFPTPNKGRLGAFGERAANMTRDGFVPNCNPIVTTTGWSAGCQCEAGAVPCIVLDPFAGAGTTLLVADRLQRDAIGIELNTSYTELAMERCRADAPLFTAFPPAEPPEDERMADLFAEAAE